MINMSQLDLAGTDIEVGAIQKAPERVYKTADEKYAAAIVLYLKSNKYYYEAAGTTEVEAADMMGLFRKGIIVMDASGNAKIPVSCSNAGVLAFANVG